MDKIFYRIDAYLSEVTFYNNHKITFHEFIEFKNIFLCLSYRYIQYSLILSLLIYSLIAKLYTLYINWNGNVSVLST